MKDQRQVMDGLTQANAVLTSTDTVIVAQLAQPTAGIGELQ